MKRRIAENELYHNGKELTIRIAEMEDRSEREKRITRIAEME